MGVDSPPPPDPDLAARFLLDRLLDPHPGLVVLADAEREFAGLRYPQPLARVILADATADLVAHGLAHPVADALVPSSAAVRAAALWRG